MLNIAFHAFLKCMIIETKHLWCLGTSEFTFKSTATNLSHTVNIYHIQKSLPLGIFRLMKYLKLKICEDMQSFTIPIKMYLTS